MYNLENWFYKYKHTYKVYGIYSDISTSLEIIRNVCTLIYFVIGVTIFVKTDESDISHDIIIVIFIPLFTHILIKLYKYIFRYELIKEKFGEDIRKIIYIQKMYKNKKVIKILDNYLPNDINKYIINEYL